MEDKELNLDDRDMLACFAMAGLVAHHGVGTHGSAGIVLLAYELADAMVKKKRGDEK